MAPTPDPTSVLNTVLQSSPLYKLSKDIAATQTLLQKAKTEKLPVSKQKAVVPGQFRWLRNTGMFVFALGSVTCWDYFVRSFEGSETHPEDEMRMLFKKQGWKMMKKTYDEAVDEAAAERKRRERMRRMQLRWSLDEGKWT